MFILNISKRNSFWNIPKWNSGKAIWDSRIEEWEGVEKVVMTH